MRFRLARIVVAFGIALGSLTLCPTDAVAQGQNFCSVWWSDQGFDADGFWVRQGVGFDPGGYIDTGEGYVWCAQLVYMGMTAHYDLTTLVSAPVAYDQTWDAGDWGAETSLELPLSQFGFGLYTVNGNTSMHGSIWWGDGQMEFYGLKYFDPSYGIMPAPTATLSASTYSTPAHSAPVQVWASIDDPEEYLPYLSEVEWSGCTPVNAVQCLLDTSTPGTKTVTWLGSFVNVWVPVSVDIEVQQPPPPPPTLKLFLDVVDDANRFQPADPITTNDADTFVPGSYRTSLLPLQSISVAQIASTGQELRVIAAYVDPNNGNTIVAPPAGITGVDFALPLVSRWKGYAVNQGSDTSPDFVLESAHADFAQNLAVVTLRCKDYGGRVVVAATAGGSTVQMPLPKDDNNDSIPDVGWVAWATSYPFASVVDDDFVDDPQSQSDVWSGDADTNLNFPTLGIAPSGSPAFRLTGDGLRVFEEYRGLVVTGVHVRFDPRIKDIFAASEISAPGMNVDDSLNFARLSLGANGYRLHRLFSHTEQGVEPEYRLLTACPDNTPINPSPTNPPDLCLKTLSINNINDDFETKPPPGRFSDTPQAYTAPGIIRFSIRGGLGGAGAVVTLGLTRGNCVSGGQVPYHSYWSWIDVNSIRSINQNLGSTGQNNEIRRTVGHELGHAIHVNHGLEPNVNETDKCAGPTGDGVTGSTNSMMYSGNGNGVGENDDRSKYLPNDARQIRLIGPY